MTLYEPFCDSAIKQGKMPGEKMIGAVDDDEFVLARKHRNKFFDSIPRAMFVIGAVYEKFWFLASWQVGEVRAVNGDTEADQLGDSGIGTTQTKSYPAAKTKARQQQRRSREFPGQKTNGSLNIALLSATFIVTALTESRTSKIEAQYWDA